MGHPVLVICCSRHLMLYARELPSFARGIGRGAEPTCLFRFHQRPALSPPRWRGPHDPASRNVQIGEPAPLIAAGSTCQSETSGNLVKLDQSASGVAPADE
jgi:hypothetical protein